MVLKFVGADKDDIKKMGRWSSDTFLTYIHDQIAEYNRDWKDKIATTWSYFNLEGVSRNDSFPSSDQAYIHPG